MKAAFAYWEHRIAPVFDTARDLLIVTADGNCIVDETRITLMDSDALLQDAFRLVEFQVETLVCGAISRYYHDLITSHRITVIPFITGECRAIIHAWLEGNLESGSFLMPGCRRGHRRRGVVPGRFSPDGCASFGDSDRKATFQRSSEERLTGNCRCPICGYREPHECDVPCVKRTCPRCAGTLIRE